MSLQKKLNAVHKQRKKRAREWRKFVIKDTPEDIKAFRAYMVYDRKFKSAI